MTSESLDAVNVTWPIATFLRRPLFALALFAMAPWAYAATPAATVESLHSALIGVMREADKLGYAGREKALRPIIEQTFYLPYIARLVLSRHWRRLTKAQQSAMVKSFSDFTVATYASRFDGFDGESFRTGDTRLLKKGRRLVKTELVKADGDTVSLDYVLQQVGEDWRIINVVADGISDLSLKRAEYSSVMKKEGFDALLRRIDAKVREYASDS